MYLHSLYNISKVKGTDFSAEGVAKMKYFNTPILIGITYVSRKYLEIL
jgi:hypothetical protein